MFISDSNNGLASNWPIWYGTAGVRVEKDGRRF